MVHVGCGDPATIFQMIVWCGQGGNPGLAILFVEEKRRKGKNNISDFGDIEFQSNDDRMDALAITEVCLRIAFLVDNQLVQGFNLLRVTKGIDTYNYEYRLGYIPLQVDDPNVIQEAEREIRLGFPKCLL